MTKWTARTVAAAGMAILAAALVWAQSQPSAAPSFEVASVKANHSGDHMVSLMNSPSGRFSAKNVSVKMLIRLAYKVQDFQIAGGPGWIDSERYDIEAKPESSGPDSSPAPSTDDRREAAMEAQRLRIQALLADRFGMTVHHDTKELPVYALVVAKGGAKLHVAAVTPDGAEPPASPNPKGPMFKGRGMRMGRGELSGQSAPLSLLAETLSNQIGRTVVDRTGLTGLYDFTLKWTPDESQPPMFPGPREAPEGRPPGDRAANADSGPSIFTAIQEQLGLKLESQKGPVPILVIDRIEKPSEN